MTRFPPNQFGIRGLRSNIGEWGLRSQKDILRSENTPRFVLLGELVGTWVLGATLIRGPKQNPAEAFISVGFRVVRNPDVKPNGMR